MSRFEINDDPPFPSEETASRRGPGRPKGAPNKAITQKLVIEQFEELYDRVEPMLTPEQKKYYKEAFRGRGKFDSLQEAELFAKLMGVYCITIVTKALAMKTASKEVAENAGQYRQLLVNIEDMHRKREEWKVKTGERADMVDPTRQPELGGITNILRGGSSR